MVSVFVSGFVWELLFVFASLEVGLKKKMKMRKKVEGLV